MTQYHKTSIIILTYNNLVVTQDCLASIQKYTDAPYELIVVDNHSTDGTAEWLRTQKIDKLILNEENLGFPKGCNQGIKAAESDNDILLLNNDTVVTQNWLNNLQTALHSRESVGAVSCLTNFASYHQYIQVAYKTKYDLQAFAKKFNVSDPDKWEERVKLVGFCMLIKRSALDKTGLLDEIFTPGYNEDDDYSYRLILAGYKLLLCKDTFIHHTGGTTFSTNYTTEQCVQIGSVSERKFKEKWGFISSYSACIRFEIVQLINQDPLDCFRVLEVGCACGATLLEIKNRYKNAALAGIEINPASARIASCFADVSVGNIETYELNYPNDYFDYIIFGDVLEHLQDPWNVLNRMKKYLAPGGAILASIPNIMHHSVLMDLLNGCWNYSDAGILDRNHLRFFTSQTIIQMFREAGYTYMQLTGIYHYEHNDDKCVKILSSITSPELETQYKVWQYLVSAKK